jgi:hypothetical protein
MNGEWHATFLSTRCGNRIEVEQALTIASVSGMTMVKGRAGDRIDVAVLKMAQSAGEGIHP